MIDALGFSQTPFDPKRPGRLCRGRERWIEPWELDEPPPEIQRLVISGARFSDESAADAQRGLPWGGVDVVSVLAALFPRRVLLAFAEDGHPADIPAIAEAVEMYDGYRAGGLSEEGLVRWHKRLSGITELRELVGNRAIETVLSGLVLIDPGADDNAVMERVFPFVGFATRDSPPARYQPSALPELLEMAKAVIVFHRDKHGPALGVYGTEPVPKPRERLQKLCDKAGSLLVPFAIPPMLARWDRALSELRTEWMASRDDEFPVPPAPPEANSWEDRRRRRRERGQADNPPGPDGQVGEVNADLDAADALLVQADAPRQATNPGGEE